MLNIYLTKTTRIITEKAGFPWTYIENKRHVTKIELALLLVKLLQLRSVVVLALLRHVRSHVSLLFGLRTAQ